MLGLAAGLEDFDDDHRAATTGAGLRGCVGVVVLCGGLGLGRFGGRWDIEQFAGPGDIGDSLEIVDTSAGAYLATADGKVTATYPSGSYFKGLARPWMGIHTVDIVRRDAVEKRVRFSSKSLKEDGSTYIVRGVTHPADGKGLDRLL